ncbi:MAG: hypothetical protein ACRDIY_20380 [Chloroflexota bacterium]
MRRAQFVLVGLLTFFAGLAVVSATTPTAQAANCQLVLGFGTLHALIPSVSGDCLTDEQYASNGDGLQATTHGLMVWRKADNHTAFTDGFHTWVNGPFGLQERLNTARFDWEKRDARVPSTQVVDFVAPTSASQPVSGKCFVSSLAATRADAYRCIAGNLLMDPCFTIPGNSAAVLCVRDPLDRNTFVQMNLTEPLPSPEPPPLRTHPWFLQLADGTVCSFFTGASGVINGQRINYGCSDGWVIVGEPTPGPAWTAQEVFLAPRSFDVEKSATVQVMSVWQ